MAFEFIDNPNGQSSTGKLSVDDYLGFRPTQANGTRYQEPNPSFRPPSADEVIQSAKTGQAIDMPWNREPVTLNSNLGKLVSSLGLDINDVGNMVTANDETKLATEQLQKKDKSTVDFGEVGRQLARTLKAPEKDPFEGFKSKEGNFRSFDVDINQNLTRYEKSGANVNKIAFNPYRNNELLYKERMSNWDDTRRAFSGFYETMKLGIMDSIGIGNYIDTNAAHVFDVANKLGSSSKDGTVGFVNNMIVSAGYTGGILLEIAAESLIMAGMESAAGISAPITGGTSVVAGAAGGVLMAGKIEKSVSKLGKAVELLSKSSTWRNTGKKALAAINPFDDITKFHKATKAGGMFQGANAIQKATGYTTNAWRGFNKIKFAYEESAMEAGTTFTETKDKAIQQFYQDNGRMPNNEEIDRIMDLSKAAAFNTFASNLPLIYGSNAFVFDGLLSPNKFVKGLGKAAEQGDIAITRGVMANGKKGFVATAIPENILDKMKVLYKNPKIAANMLKRNIGEYMADNTIEGLQEVLQDTIQDASQQKFANEMSGNPGRGSYYNYLLSNMGNMLTSKGLESFASGFLMQMLISPIAKFSSAAAQVPNWKAAGKTLTDGLVTGIASTPVRLAMRGAERLSNREEIEKAGGYDQWKAKKKKEEWEKANPGQEYKEDQLDQDVKMLNDYFQDPIKYLNPMLNQGMQSKDLAKYKMRCQIEGDKMGYIDCVDSDAVNNMNRLLNYGGLKQVNKILDDLVSNTTKEEFEDGDYGISYEDYMSEIEKTRNYAKNLQTKKDNLDEVFENPFHLEWYKEGTKEYEQAAIGWSAYETAKRQVLFQQMQVEDALRRVKEIGDNLNKTIPLNKTPYQGFKILTGMADIQDEMGNLEREISAIDPKVLSKMSDEMKQDVEIKKNKLEELKNITNAIEEQIRKKLSDEEVDLSSLTSLLKDYTKDQIATTGDIMPNDNQIKDLAQNVIDANLLGRRAMFAAQAVNVLMDPVGLDKRAEAIKEWMTKAYENKEEEIRKALQAFRREAETNEMMRKLHALGVFFFPDDLDDLENKGEIPTLYETVQQVDGNGKEKLQEVVIGSEKYQQAIDIISEYYPNIKGVHINTEERVEDYEKDLAEDGRSLKDILAEYEITLGENNQVTIPFKELIRKAINKAKKDRQKAFLESMLTAVGDSNITIAKGKDRALSYDSSTGDIIIDPRYSAKEYEESYIRFEDLISRAAITKVLHEKMQTDDVLKKRLEDLYQETKDYIDANSDEYPNLKTLQGMGDVYGFVAKAMTDTNFAGLLANIESSVPSTRKENTLWDKFIEIIKAILGGEFPNSVLNGLHENLSHIFPDAISITEEPSPRTPTPTDVEERERVGVDDSHIPESKVPSIEKLEKDKESLHSVVDEYKRDKKYEKELEEGIPDNPDLVSLPTSSGLKYKPTYEKENISITKEKKDEIINGFIEHNKERFSRSRGVKIEEKYFNKRLDLNGFLTNPVILTDKGNVKGCRSGWKVRFNIKNPKTGGHFSMRDSSDPYFKSTAEKVKNFLVDYFTEATDTKVEFISGDHCHITDKDGFVREPFKFLSGGRIGVSDFTIYIGSLDDCNKFIEQIKNDHKDIYDLLILGDSGRGNNLQFGDSVITGRIEGGDIGFGGYDVPDGTDWRFLLKDKDEFEIGTTSSGDKLILKKITSSGTFGGTFADFVIKDSSGNEKILDYDSFSSEELLKYRYGIAEALYGDWITGSTVADTSVIESSIEGKTDEEILSTEDFKNWYKSRGISSPAIYNFSKKYHSAEGRFVENHLKSAPFNKIGGILEKLNDLLDLSDKNKDEEAVNIAYDDIKSDFEEEVLDNIKSKLDAMDFITFSYYHKLLGVRDINEFNCLKEVDDTIAEILMANSIESLENMERNINPTLSLKAKESLVSLIAEIKKGLGYMSTDDEKDLLHTFYDLEVGDQINNTNDPSKQDVHTIIRIEGDSYKNRKIILDNNVEMNVYDFLREYDFISGSSKYIELNDDQIDALIDGYAKDNQDDLGGLVDDGGRDVDHLNIEEFDTEHSIKLKVGDSNYNFYQSTENSNLYYLIDMHNSSLSEIDVQKMIDDKVLEVRGGSEIVSITNSIKSGQFLPIEAYNKAANTPMVIQLNSEENLTTCN